MFFTFFKLYVNKNKLHKTLSRDMFNFDFVEKGLRIVFSPYFVYDIWFCVSYLCISCYTLLTDQIPLSDCLWYWPIYYWNRLFPSLQFHNIWMKSQNKNLNFWRTKRALRWNKKHFSSFYEGSQLPKIFSDLRVRLSQK